MEQEPSSPAGSTRRTYLRSIGTATLAGIAVPGVAGCLERLGFEERSAWADPPLVEDRPDAVYVPAAAEEMGAYGAGHDGDWGVALSYTFPHRFWTVAGTERRRVTVEPADSLHLMVDTWDLETGTVLPVDSHLTLARDGETVVDRRLWPMLSQRMGFHYGDNVRLPGEGEYVAEIRVGPLQAETHGDFDGRLNAPATVEIPFAYDRAAVLDLELERIPTDRRGSRDALPLMHDAGGDRDEHGSTHPPSSRAVPVEDLPGSVILEERTGDARLVATMVSADRFSDGTYLAVSPRTPYNDVVLPFTGISGSITGSTDTDLAFVESLDHELGHHYGTTVPSIEPGDSLELVVEPPPQVSRHDGYETAFFEFEPVSRTI